MPWALRASWQWRLLSRFPIQLAAVDIYSFSFSTRREVPALLMKCAKARRTYRRGGEVSESQLMPGQDQSIR